MPSTYAHYRFGQLAMPALPEDIRRSVQRFRQLYDVGLHGPDLFFYYQPLFHTRTGALGSAYHAMTGRAFFETSVERLRQNPSEGATSYLFGVLGHFALDSACHPLIHEIADQGKIGHTELETEFDRHLLTLDGKSPAHTQNTGRHLKLTWGECVTVADFYPPATVYAIRQSIRIMALSHRALACKNRKLLQRVFTMGGEYASEMVMYPRPNHKCAHLNGQLQALFQQALDRYPDMAAQLSSHIQNRSPLGAEFDTYFG